MFFVLRASALAVIAVCVTATPARADLASGLVGYWKLDEAPIAATTAAMDSSTMGHHGLYVNTPLSFAGVPLVTYANPSSVALTRASDHAVQIPNMPAALKPAAVTISVWYATATIDTTMGGNARSELVSAGDSYILYLRAAGPGAGCRQSGGAWADVVATTPTALDGSWHHVAATFDAAGMAVYFDGSLAGSVQRSGAIVYDLGNDLWFGRYGNGSMSWDFEGNLDEVAIFNRVLSAAEIAELARGAQPGGVVVIPVDPGPEAAVNDGAVSDGAAGADGASNDAPAEATSADAGSGGSGGTVPGGSGGFMGTVDAATDTAADHVIPPFDVSSPDGTSRHGLRDAPSCAYEEGATFGWMGLLLMVAALTLRSRRPRGLAAAPTRIAR